MKKLGVRRKTLLIYKLTRKKNRIWAKYKYGIFYIIIHEFEPSINMVCFISLSLSVNMTVEVKKSVFGCEVGASGQGQPYPNEIPFRVPKQNPGSCILSIYNQSTWQMWKYMMIWYDSKPILIKQNARDALSIFCVIIYLFTKAKGE